MNTLLLNLFAHATLLFPSLPDTMFYFSKLVISNTVTYSLNEVSLQGFLCNMLLLRKESLNCSSGQKMYLFCPCGCQCTSLPWSVKELLCIAQDVLVYRRGSSDRWDWIMCWSMEKILARSCTVSCRLHYWQSLTIRLISSNFFFLNYTSAHHPLIYFLHLVLMSWY